MPYYWDDARQISLPVPAGGVPGGGNGLFGGLMGGGQPQYGGLIGAAGGGDIDTNALMNQLIRRQLQQSMQPDWGRISAAFAEAAMPSRLPVPMGAVLGKVAGAMSGGDADGTKTLQMLHLMQQIKASQAQQALQGQIPGMTKKLLDVVKGYNQGGPGTGGAGGNLTPPGGAVTGASKGGGLGYGQLTQLALDAGFPAEDAPIMAAISMGESSGNPNAKKVDDVEASYGITQINARAHPGGEKALGDPVWAMQKAKELYDARRERGQRGFEDWSVWKNGIYKQHLQGALAAQPTPYESGARVELPEVPSYGSSLAAAPRVAAAPSPALAASPTPGASAAAPDWAVGPPLPPLSPQGTQQQQFAAGRAPQLPPGTQFNRRGEAVSPDLRATLPGQQSGPNISPDVLRGFAQANAGGSGGGIPAAVAEEPGGGGDDSGLVPGGGARPPVPGIFGPQVAAPAAPPVPGVLTPPVAPPPAAGPGSSYTLPTLPNIPSQIPKPPPLPDTRQTQEVLAAIAAMRAQTQALKLGDPFGALHDAIVQSPRFKSEQEAVAKAAAHPYELDLIRQRTEEAIREKRMLYPQEIDMLLRKSEQDRQTALAAMGLRRNPQTGEVEKDPGFAPAKAETEGLVADVKARVEQKAILEREQEMRRFEVDPNAIGAPTAAPQQTGPGYTEALPTKRGTIIPPHADAAPIVGSPKELEQRQTGKGGWAETQSEWNNNLTALRKVQQTALAVADVMKSYQTGSFAGELSDIRAKLKAVGIHLPESIAGDPAAAQKIIKDNFSQTITSLKGFDSNPAVYQIKLAFENWANTNLQPEANLSILSKAVGTSEWQEQMVHDFAEAKKYGWRDPGDFMRAWGARPENSLQAFIDRAGQKIGPLAGAPQSPSASGLPTGVPQGAKQIGTYNGDPVYELPDGSRKVLRK